VVIPGFQNLLAVVSQVPNNSVQLVRAKPDVGGDGQVIEPEFGLLVSGPDMDVCRLTSFIRVEERTMGTPAENGWHISTS
jgi:hypothetical protein